MFNLLKNSNWRNSSAHLLLLSKFQKSNSFGKYLGADYWEIALKQKPSKVLQQFLKDEVLEPADLQEIMDYKFKVSDLKLMLKEKGLKVSGRKDELIKRLIASDEKGMHQFTKGLEIYRCTKEGLQLTERYIVGEKVKREAAEKDVLAFLERKDFSNAVSVVVRYETSQVFPRGLGINWENYDVESAVKELKIIFEKIPGILMYMERGRIDRLRIAAAMMQLWGTNEARRWLPENFETGIRLDADVAARMIIFYVSHIRNMQSYRLASVNTVEVLCVDDGNTCSNCRKISEKKYTLESVPELPYAKCTCEFGCRCTTILDDYI